jgi:hypothetical protein
VGERNGSKGDKEMGVSLKNVKMAVITDESQAGQGFASFSDVYPQATDGKHRERVKRGIAEGRITAKRLIRTTKDIENGEIYIDLEQTKAWLSSAYYDPDHDSPKRGVTRKSSPGPASGDCDEQTGLVISVLERIAEALETIATNPRNDDHTPFGSLLHASTNGDE